MQLESIHIYGFGQYENFKIRFDEPIQVIYGCNEAGKTTIMQFIKSMLFGFPTRSKNRYLPRTSKRYGGKLTITTSNYGRMTIERVDETANVKVTLADGSIHGKAFLETVLEHMDEAHFKGIFSFGLSGLQNIEKIQDDELNDFLLGAGMTGDVSVSEIEQKLIRKQQELFKVNGRKPEINEQLKRIESLEDKLQKIRQKIDQYDDLMQEKNEKQRQLEDIQKTEKELHTSIKLLEKALSILPLYEEREQLHYQLESLPPYEPFPEDGLKRYQTWQAQYVPLKADLVHYKKQYELLIEESAQIDTNNEILLAADRLQGMREAEAVYHLKNQEITSLEKEVRDLHEELDLLLEKLGETWTIQAVISADTSIVEKERIFEIIAQAEQSSQKQFYVEEDLEQAKHKVTEAETKVKRDKLAILSDEKRNHLERMKELLLQKEVILTEQGYSARSATKGSARKVSSQFSNVLLVLAVVLTSILFYIQEPIIAAIVLLASGIIVGFLKSNEKSQKQGRLKQVNKKLRYIANEVDQELSSEEISALLSAHHQAVHSLHVHQELLDDAESYLEKAIRRYDEWQERHDSLTTEFQACCQTYHLPTTISYKGFRKAFELIELAKEKHYQLKKLTEKLEQLQKELLQWEQQVEDLCQLFRLYYDANWSKIFEKMQTKVSEEKNKERRKIEIEEVMKELKPRVEQIAEKCTSFEEKWQRLFTYANVNNEEDFTKKASANQKANEIKQKLVIVDAQFSRQLVGDEASIINSKLYDGKNVIIKEIEQINEQLNQSAIQTEQLLKSITSASIMLKQLEEDGSYSELLQQFENEKSKLNELAEEWVVYALAVDLLQSTKYIFRDARLPKVIEAATDYLTIFTNNRYVKILAPANELSFIIERNDGEHFTPSELSTGTTEQLYLALRLALANMYPSAAPYPLIVDDIFVNFDEQRTAKAMDVFRKAGKTHQILFFTCHHHLLNYFTEEEIITLSGANGIQEERSEATQ